MKYNRKQTSLFWIVVIMMKTDAKNRTSKKSDWIVDRTTTNAERKDKVESYQDDVRVEKNKMIKSSSQKIRTMYDTDQTNEKKKWKWRKKWESNRCFDKLLEMNCKKRNESNSNVINDQKKLISCIDMRNHLSRRHRKLDRTITIERVWNLRRDENSKTRWIVSKIRSWNSELRITTHRRNKEKDIV